MTEYNHMWHVSGSRTQHSIRSVGVTKKMIITCMMLGLAKSFLLSATTRRFNDRWGWRSELTEEIGIRASLTSMTRSASLSRLRMARVAAAMCPGNQLMSPPPVLKSISPKPFFNNPFNAPIFFFSAGEWTENPEVITVNKPMAQYKSEFLVIKS